MKNPGKYRSVSALAPITNPINCPWGQKAFTGYFGASNKSKWAEHDATELLKKWEGPFETLIDVGTGDNFYKNGQLLPENFEAAAKEKGVEKGVNVRYQKVSTTNSLPLIVLWIVRKLLSFALLVQDYDHSYFFISTFAEDHVNYHAKFLLK